MDDWLRCVKGPWPFFGATDERSGGQELNAHLRATHAQADNCETYTGGYSLKSSILVSR